MRNYIQALQSQIARNSAEITFRESEVFEYKRSIKSMTILSSNLDEDNVMEHFYTDHAMGYDIHVASYRKCIMREKKQLKILVANQKALKKLLGELIFLENHCGGF